MFARRLKLRLTLIGAFSVPLLRQSMHKRIFGKPKIEYTRVLQIGGFVYESGALVGRALAGKASTLEKLLGDPEQEGDLIAFMRQMARKRKESFPEENSFPMLVMKTEMSKVGLSPLDAMSDPRVLEALRHKLPADEMQPVVERLGIEGIGFGLTFPEDTERMYRSTYETFDEDSWAEAHQAGLAVPERPTPYPLEQRETEVLTLVAEYVHEFRPELDDALGLGPLLS